MRHDPPTTRELLQRFIKDREPWLGKQLFNTGLLNYDDAGYELTEEGEKVLDTDD